MSPSRLRPRRRLLPKLFVLGAGSAGLLGHQEAQGQTVYRWNSTGTAWNNSSHWIPSGVPNASTDIALFNHLAGTVGTVEIDPSLTTSQTVNSLGLALNQNFGGWTLSGTGTLTVGGASSVGITTGGPATYIIDGPTLQGANASTLLTLNVLGGSTLVLQGNTSIAGNQGLITIGGGSTLRLDNSSVTLGNRILSANSITINGGGSTLEIIGNAATGLTMSLPTLNRPDNGIGGRVNIRVNPNGNFANLTFANAGTFSLRAGTRNIIHFETTSGAMGDSTGAQIRFVGTPFTNPSVGSLFVNTATGATRGWAIVTDSYGTHFATYTAANGVMSVANPSSGANFSVETDSLANITAANTNYQLNISASTTLTATAAPQGASLRIVPGPNSSLDLGTNNLLPLGIMLDGPNDFTITGNGVLGSGGTKYFYVNNPNTTLFFSNRFTTTNNPAIFAGPGIVALTANSLQNDGTVGDNYRITIAGGVLRGNNTQMGFDTTRGVINLYGGVLEITNGGNGTGTSADFRRPLGTAGGNVNWGAGVADRGSGGFSAFGSNASVNIGGNATPATLTWNQTNFVADGYALHFGSIKSNAVLTFLNPINLGNGLDPYQLREIQVTAGAGGDRTILAGEITGTAAYHLLKTGTGTLELAADNTYAGDTLVHGGLLLATSANSTGSGNVIVAHAGTVGGTGTIAGNVLVGAGGAVAPGLSIGTLNVGGSVTFNSGPVGNASFRVELGPTASPTADLLNLTSATSTLNFNTNTILKLLPAGFDAANDATYVLATLVDGDNIQVDNVGVSNLTVLGTRTVGGPASGPVNIDVSSLSGLSTGDLFTLSRWGNNVVLTYTVVPEPTSVMLLAGAGLGVWSFVRRRRKTPPLNA